MSEEVGEISAAAATPITEMAEQTPAVSSPPAQYRSKSLRDKAPAVPLVVPKRKETVAEITPKSNKTPRTPRLSLTPRFLTPLGSPIRKALHLTKLDPQDAWLPITESRNGNAYYAAFHTLSSGIGIQALILPVAYLAGKSSY